jgi:dienelactone hydrolase
VHISYVGDPTGIRVAGIGPLPALDGPPRPLVLMLPGFGCGPALYSHLANRLAADGMVAVSYANLETLPGGVQMYGPGADLLSLSAGEYGTRQPCRLFDPIVDAIRLLVDTPGSPLFSAIDVTRIGLVGHSAGAALALAMVGRSFAQSVGAVSTWGGHGLGTAMGGWTPGEVGPISTEVPILIAGGSQDGVIANALSQGRYGPNLTVDDCYERTAAACGNLAELALFEGAGHFTICNGYDRTTASGFMEPDQNEGTDAGHRALVHETISQFLGSHLGVPGR